MEKPPVEECVRVRVREREGVGLRRAVYCSCEKKSAPSLRAVGPDALMFNYQGVIPIQMSHQGVGAQVWLWLW